jgi:hypothetical protein
MDTLVIDVAAVDVDFVVARLDSRARRADLVL